MRLASIASASKGTLRVQANSGRNRCRNHRDAWAVLRLGGLDALLLNHGPTTTKFSL